MDADTARQVAAEHLRDAVHRSGLTAAAFARGLGTSPQRFSTYVTGKVSPSAALYVRALAYADELQGAHQACAS